VQCAPPNWKDPKLVLGGLLFGLGWALAGSCPGPMLTTMVMVFTQPSTGGGGHAVILLCTCAGMWIADACTDYWCVSEVTFLPVLLSFLWTTKSTVRVHGVTFYRSSFVFRYANDRDFAAAFVVVDIEDHGLTRPPSPKPSSVAPANPANYGSQGSGQLETKPSGGNSVGATEKSPLAPPGSP
jgi:hypothetical protein